MVQAVQVLRFHLLELEKVLYFFVIIIQKKKKLKYYHKCSQNIEQIKKI